MITQKLDKEAPIESIVTKTKQFKKIDINGSNLNDGIDRKIGNNIDGNWTKVDGKSGYSKLDLKKAEVSLTFEKNELRRKRKSSVITMARNSNVIKNNSIYSSRLIQNSESERTPRA